MLRIPRICLAAMWLVATVWPATAGTLDEVRARGRLIVGVKVDYAPLGFLDAQGKNAGVEVELARFVAAALLDDPARVEFVPVVFKNRVDYLLSGKIDMILATMVVTPERLKVVDATIPYLRPGGATLMAPKAGPVTSWETTRGQTVCANESSYFIPAIESQFGAKVVEQVDAEHAYRMMAAGRCAAYAEDEILARLKVKEPEWSGYAIVGEPLQVNGHHIGVRKDDQPFLAALNHLILEAQAQGKLVEWERQYGMDADPWSLEQVKAATNQLGR